MTTRPAGLRAGVTLIELLVVMAIITALGLLALMLLPGINNSDGALKGTEEVRAQIKIAQALAGAARQPRGVRFLVGGNTTNPTAATELQLLESPPVAAIDPVTLALKDSDIRDGVTGAQRVNAAPYVELVYELIPPPGSGAALPPGQVANAIGPAGSRPLPRHCYIVGLDPAQKAQVEPGAMLYLPTLGGAWSRINSKTDPAVNAPPGYALASNTVEVVLDVYPDAAMGASTHYRTYHAGIYGTPVPLLGVPTIPLPKDIGVDLPASIPAPTAGIPYDIMFAPDGQTIVIGRQFSNAGVYLWVRDITKTVNRTTGAGGLATSMKFSLGTEFNPVSEYYQGFRIGGEHHAVGINNGAVGTAPVQWPDANGTYPAGSGGPFGFVRRKTN